MNGRIVSVTFSPTLDIATTTDVVAPTHKLRCRPAIEQAGGGGINVARVALRLGGNSIAIVPVGGHTGHRVRQLVLDEALATAAVEVAARTRQSFAVFEASTGDQYRFVLPAPQLDLGDLDRVVTATIEECSDASCLVISGRAPSQLPDGWFTSIVAAVAPIPVIVDTSGPALQAALRCGASLAKPSARELSGVVGRDLVTEHDILGAAIDVHAETGIDALVVSIGAGGGFLVTADAVTRFRAPSVRVRSAVGAGDSMVAGIAVGVARGDDLTDAVRLGVAAGTAAVLTDATDLCRCQDVDTLLPAVTIEAAHH